MEWVKLAAGYWLDPAILRAGDDAELLFVRALSSCGVAESGGFVQTKVPVTLTPTRTRARVNALVREGLWTPVADGWQVTQWGRWQEEHDLSAERKRRDRDRKRAARAAARPRTVRGQSAECPHTEEEEEKESAAAAALPPELTILKAQLDARKLTVRWDTLTDAEIATIVDLQHLHGDGPLIAAALRAYQPDRPLVYAKGWISHWRALPPPGTLALAPNPKCAAHGLDEPCRSCRADRLAEGCG